MAQINDVEKLYNALKRDGYDDLGTLDEFSSRVADRDKARQLYDSMQREGYDDLGTADEFYSRLNPLPVYKPTAEEMAGFQQTIGQARQTVAGSQQASRRIAARQKHAEKTNYGLTPGTPKLGQNSKVVETDPKFNIETGKLESTYITEQGNEYRNREGADIEQNTVDLANHMQTLPGQLQDAYAERERLNQLMEQRRQQIEAEKQNENGFSRFLREAGRAAVSDKMPDYIAPADSWENDSEMATLMSSYRQNEQRIIALEAERDDDGGTQFWRGFVDAAKNPGTLSFGLTDFQDMAQLMTIKAKVDQGEELTENEESLLKNTMANGYAQQMFGNNRGFMYRAGGISMQALPFVGEFMLTGGFSTLTEMGASAGTRVAEKFALEGLKKTILRNTGVLMGDIASGFLMANTTGAARTGADIMERNIGQVTMDEEGNYQFEGGKSLGRSIYEGEVASTLEYYTEKLGEHLQLGSWLAKGADKMGLSKLSKAVNYLSNSKMLNAGGIQDYPSEVVEEQANLLLNAILVGDNNFSTDPNSKDFDKSVFNPQTQLDIWGGMMFSIGLMQAPRLVHTGYNAAGYYAYKHTTDVADANAGIVFGQDNWQMIREQIDNCDNEHLGELLQSVIDGDMNDVQKTAVMNYAGNLLKMRGYNMGMMSDVRGGEDFESEEGFLSHGIDQGYQQGHEAQEPDDKKLIIDEANEAEAQLSQFFTEQDIQWIASTSPMDAINVMLNNRGTEPGQWNDEEIAAVVDYYQKQARAQGVMDAAADDVEYQVAKANAEVDANTHKAVNMMILAESGGEQFYIVGGDVALTADVEEGKYLFDNERTGDALIVRNAETGEISVKSPQALSISLVHDPNQLKTANEVELRQQLVQQHEDEITFGSPAQEVFQLNDTVTLNDGQGNIIEGEIGMMPASIDGAYVVYTSDGRAMQLTDDDLNKMIIAHNGMEVQRTTLTAPVEQNEAVLEQETPPVEQNQQQSAQQQPEEEQPQSALDRIPFLQDEPILNRKGKKQYQWHKASVDDTADALTETTGGDMVMARDTAKDLIEVAKGKLEKIRKQKPKGDDPIEIAEHRADIRRQEQEQQAIVKHWQDVNQAIQRRMQAESVRREEERRAALTEEQRRQEDERKRQEQERRDQIAAERRKQQIEEDLRNWNKPYQPLEQAKREMADDADAMAILSDTEPQGLDEWVSSLLRPQSIMWNDEEVDGRTVTGLQSELGLSWSDMQRFGALIGGKGKGKPFGQVVHEIWEDLPEGIKNQYDDQDVRNVLLSLFNESDARRMRNLAAEHRIEQAREMMKENQRREAEYEMEAWADFYHLTPEERETFEDFMQQPPMEPEQAIIDQIIADNESNTRSKEVDSQHPERTAGSEGEGGQGQVQGEGSQVEGVSDSQQQGQQGAEADTGGPSLSDNDVPGGILTDRIVDSERSERLKKGLTDAYASGDSQAIQQTVDGIRDYIEEGGDFEGGGNWDVEDYEGNDPHILTEQYITRALFDVYLDSDEDQEYIATGLRADMRKRFDEVEDSERYASRFVENDDLEESETANGTEYHQTLTIDGQHIVEKVDAPDDKGYHTGSHYLFDGQRFGGLREVFEYIDGRAAETQQPTQQEAAQPFTSFEDMKANIPETVTDPAMQKALRKIVDKMFQHGSSNLRRDDRGFDYTFVYMAGGTTKADRGLLQPWGSQSEVEYNDNNPTATWVDEKEQRIYFIKYNPEGTRYRLDFVITGYMAMPKPIGSTSTPEEIASEEAKVEQNPTEGQKEAGNYQKGHIKVDGYDITIENPKGSVRRGTDANGQSWETEMHNTYGYIRGTEGVDGDHIDVFLSDTPTSGKVFVVDQVNSDGSFDEHKVMYGFASEEDARAAYLSNYSEGWQGLGAITPVSRKDFKKWVQSSHRKTKPFAEYKSVKKEPVAEPQAAQPAGEPAGTVANPSGNKLVTDERYAELKERMKKKLLGQFNMGVDPEILAIGTEMAVYHIEKGARQFVEYAKGMIADLGDAIRPYLKAFYNGARDLPEMAELSQTMDAYEDVSKFDVFNFDKQQAPTPVEKAQQVVSEKKAEREAKEAVEKIQEIAKKGSKSSGKKKQQPQGPSLFDLFEETNTEESETNQAKTETNEPKAETSAKKRKNPGRSAWWNDPNMPESIDRSDYTTYTTDEAKAYFASFRSEDGKTDFTKWVHPNLAYITAAVWDEVEIPYEALKDIPEIVEAENTIKQSEANGSLVISDEETEALAQRLLDASEARQEHKALVIIGLPAGGKSSVFANPLSKEHGARIIDSDDVKPWLNGFDGGNGAGYVHDASAKVAEKAIDLAVRNGDNIIIPRIGGKSVMALSAALRLAGYDVQLYFNDVKGVTSIDRAASRFAQTGRYLSLDYLTKKAGVPSENFSKFAEQKIGDYLDERTEKELQDIRGRLQGLLGELAEQGEGLRLLDASQRRREGTSEGAVQESLGSRGLSDEGGSVSRLLDPLFTYAEWKSNDVPLGEKPKEIWNSESGKPLPGKETNNGAERKVSRKSEQAGQGAEQARGTADRAGEERSPEQNRAERSGSGHSVENTLGVVDAAEQTRSGSINPTARANSNARKAVSPILDNNRRNNVGERGKDYAPLSPKARFNANVDAIRLMRELMEQGIDAPTSEQMEVLRKYSGWGGLGTFFNDEKSAENRLLHDLLSEEEYHDAVLSIKTAYYTPAYVIDTLWDVAKQMGFKGGNVLEGSAGIGNIIGQMPREMSSRSNIEAVEIDAISGNILKLLYPDAKVHIQGFQDTVIRNGSVDLAITNVPFAADLHVIDKTDKDLSRKFRTLHDFCIAKNIRKLREGGIGIFITTSGTLDKSNKLRQWITDEAQTDVIGAFRLNNKSFGGANVTSDIIIVKKRVGGVKSENAINIAKASPLRTGEYEAGEAEYKRGEGWVKDIKSVSMVINDYFHDHPEAMAGEMFFSFEKGDTYRPESYGLYPAEGKDQEKMLADWVKGIKEQIGSVSAKQQEEEQVNQLTGEKEGRMLVDDKGRLCVSERGIAVPLALNDQKVKGQTKQQCFKDYQAVQKAVDDVLQQQLSDPDDAALKPKLDALNKAFDLFVKRYGPLHKNTSISFLRNDIDFPSFLALENYSETKDMKGKVTVTTSKSPVFKQRVLGFKTEPQPKTVKDAVTASLFRNNTIDVDWIAEKLDMEPDAVRQEVLSSRLGFEDPTTGSLEIRYKYLSGNVREKLAIAEAYNDSEESKGRYDTNVEELRKAVPMDIPAHLIDFSLGSSWIPMELYTQYMEEVYDLSNVKIAHLEGAWVLDPQYRYHNEKNRAAGVYSEQFKETIYGHQLVAAALNNRPIKVARQVSHGYGSSKTTETVVDKDATQACAVRVDEIKDEFKQWAKKKMQEDEELSQRIEKIYNEKFNAVVPMQIDDEFLPDIFEGANMNISLYGHQKRGVMRGITSPTMLAHEVGTGKSFTLISTAMEMRRLGTAKKPMIVVQNATVAQMTADAKLLYPNAKILSLSEKDRSAEGRRSFYAKIKYNDWDIIIVPQSTFERIPDSPARELQFIQEKIDEKKHVIEMAEESGMDSQELKRMQRELESLEQEYGDKFLDSGEEAVTPKSKKKDAKKEEAALENAATKAKEMLDRQVDDVQYFDDLGVDALLVDEAHEYKHLGFQTSIGRGIKGIDPSYSKKCAGLYNKTRSVFEKAGWRNVVFATGTPISNTAAEIWTFMKYLMPADVMRQNDIYYFDDFVHNFGAISQMLEFTTSGKFKENTRFAAYLNKPELIRIWSQVADTVLTKEVGKVQEKIPELENGKDQDVFLPQSPSLISIMAAVRAELERFENMSGKEKKENSSIPLTMYGIAKRAAIDPRLVNPDAPDEPLSKTNAAVKEIVKDLKATESYKGTVAVFCDNQNRLGNNAAGKKVVEFNIYDDMREKLIAQGVPAEQIAIIKSGMSITAKQKIFDAVNAGGIRVVLGSTQTLGTGVNMQERLHLLIHMDAPDRPMDYTQRNGRIKRQGNLHKTWGKSIRVIRFGVEDSLDVTAYQRLKTKSGFIDSIMDGKGALLNNQVDRTVEEEEEGLFDNPVAVLSGSQYALKKNQAERELRKYQNKKQQYEADQVYVANTIRKDKGLISANEGEIERSEKNIERISKMFPDGKVKVITIQGEKVDMTAEGAEEQLSKVMKEKVNDPINALVKRNRENAIYNDVNVPVKLQLDGHDLNITVSIEREMVNEGGRMRTVIHQYSTYECKALGIETMMRSSERVRDILDYVLDYEVTAKSDKERIEAMQGKNQRLQEEVAVLQERVGLKFQFDNELAEAEKKVEEYTELMKQEMAEKEAKYASVAVDTVDLSKSEASEEDDTRYRTDDAWGDEEALIIEQAKANDTYMRAPNGKPSNLNERQWVQVRTQAFKDWFGDWENDPDNASKVVDENGEPLVQYHSTNLEWVNKGEPFWEFYEDSHFGTEGQALDRMPAKSGVKVYAVFLNIRNPQRRNDADQDYLDEKDMTMSEYWEQCARRSKYNGYDGIVYLNEYEDKEHPADSWIAFRPEQVKSADENIGTFDADDPDIRHRDDEQFADGEVIPVHKEYQLGVDGLGLPSRRTSYSTDLLPDSYPTMQSLLDAIRNAYEGYYAEVNDDQSGIVMRSWNSVLSEGRRATTAKQKKGKEAYLERKTRRAIAAVNELAHRLKIDVEVLTTTDGLKGKKAMAKGWYNAKTGKITVVLPNHYSQADLLRTLMHEGVAHYGLRQMFGEHFDTFLDNIYNNVSPDLKRVIDAAMKHNGWSQREATEEYLARLAEHTDFEHATQQGWWSKIKEFFMRMLAQAGFRLQDGVTFSDNELRYVLWRSYENLRVPNARRSIFDTAKEIQMQSRFGVGRYAREHSRLQNTGRMNTSQYAAAERYSLRTKEPPKKTGIGYKVFYLHNGQLYPPMVANPGGAGTPVGVWLDADDAPVVAVTKSGRKKVKAGGKGTQGGSGQLAHRPGWHLGTIPFALQFNRGEKVDNPLGITNNDGDIIKVGKYFPNDFVWAEVEYANDENYQDEAESYGYKENGKFQHSLAGLPKIPEDGSYTYRTNPNPATDPWIITGAMRVNRILSREEVADIVKQAGREPQLIQDGDIVSQEAVDALNEEIAAMRQADDMGLLFRDDDDWLDTDVDIARQIYEQAAAEGALKFQEAWQDSMAGLKVLQNAIEQETGNKASGAEDAYLYENRMHGKAKNQSETFDRQYYRPILKALDALMKDRNLSHDAAMQYLIAKHGLERNIFYAFKEAVTSQVQENINKEQQKLTRRYERGEIDAKEYKKLQQELSDSLSTDVQNILTLVATDAEHIQNKSDYENGRITYADYISRESDLRRRYAPDFDDNRRDYSGLTELTGDEEQYEVEALAMVMDVEDNSSPKTTRLVNSLWNTINAATKESLRFSYESGQLSRTQYNNIKQMFEYYVPLRGWAEDNADDAYDYVTQRNVFSTAVKKTYGRKSVAENPIAYIGNMAVSTILAGHRNLMKQHFLNYVMNNPTSLVSISEQWWENKGSETSPYWVEVRPEIPAGASADEIADIVEAFNEDMKEKQKLGMAMNQKGKLHIKYHATASEKDEHMVEVQRNGKTYQLYINGNPKAAQALNGANSRSVTRITDVPGLGWIPKLSRMMAANFTSRNPAFIISNMSRDLNMAGASVAVKEDAAYNARFIANVAKVLSPRVGRVSRYGLMGRFDSRQGFTGLMPSLMRKYLAGELNPADETERYFKEFMDEGAETGFVNMLSVDSFKDKMAKELGRMQGTTFNPIKARKGTKEMHITKGLRMMGEIFEFYNRCAEDATRFIVYMTSRQMGKTLEDSVADAKDVTLNFNRKGTGAMMNGVIRDLFIFTNPAIQALANMYKMAYKHPLKLTAVTAAFVAGGMLMPVINQWLLQMFGDGDDKDAYWNLPPWVRKNNLVMWIPGTKNFITIPLAQEFRVFYGMGEMTSSLIYEHPVHNWPLEITSSFMDLVPINPTGNAGKLSIDLMPTVFQPLMQIGENTDFTGKPLWKENQGNKWAPMYTKAYASTPAWMVDLAHLTNEIGGNEGRKGWIEEYSPFWGNYVNNPAVWNHLLQGYFGGMYNTVAKAFDVGVTAGKGEVPKVYQTPIINRFLNRPVERDNGGALGEEYYSLIAERDKVQYEVRTWKRKAAEGDEDAQRKLDELMKSERYKRAEVISHYDKIMKDLKADERAIKDGAAHSDKDLHDIQESMQLYKVELLDELSSIGDGKSSLDAAIEKFNNAKSFAEKNKLRLRIERLMMEDANGKQVGRSQDVESRKTSELYLQLASGQDIAEDARIRAAKAKIKTVTGKYKELKDAGRGEEAAAYREQHSEWFAAENVIGSQQRGMASNKKLLGKGYDQQIMKLIKAQRDRMLEAIEGLE